MITFTVAHLLKTLALVFMIASGMDLVAYEQHTVEATPALKATELIVFTLALLTFLIPL